MSMKRMGAFARDGSGGIAMVTALSMPILVGMAGLAVETMEMTWIRRTMQRQADSGALAGAFALSQDRSVAATATSDMSRNGNGAFGVTSVVENGPTAGSYAGNNRAVRVVLTSSMRLPLTTFFTRNGQRLVTEATAALIGMGEYCVVALETSTTVPGLSMGGSSNVNLHCGMISNAPAAASVVTNGNAGQITATPIAAVGGIPPSTLFAPNTEIFPYTVPQRDPYASLADPVITGSTQSGAVGANNKVTRINPGVYDGFTPKGDIVLNPGTYIIDGGSFKVNAGTSVTGTGVTFVLTSRTVAGTPSSVATMAVNGGATLDITAPSTGTYAGILIYQDRRASDGSEKINGGSSWKLEGVIYMAAREVQFNGDSGMNIRCVKLVGKRITFTGNTSVVNICPAYVPGILGTKVKLVA